MKGFLCFWQFCHTKSTLNALCGILMLTSIFQSFFESHHAPAAERTVQQCCENILLNAAWLKRDADDIHQYLLQRKGAPVWTPVPTISLLLFPYSAPSYPIAPAPATQRGNASSLKAGYIFQKKNIKPITSLGIGNLKLNNRADLCQSIKECIYPHSALRKQYMCKNSYWKTYCICKRGIHTPFTTLLYNYRHLCTHSLVVVCKLWISVLIISLLSLILKHIV